MSMDKIQSAEFSSKSDFKLPEGAKIVKKDYTIRVEEIENGFIISKNYDIKYLMGDETSYDYFTKKWFSKENPMESLMEDEEDDKSLADTFDED